MRDTQEQSVKHYHCPTHGNVQDQVFTMGYFDKHRNFIQNTFCGICHFKMLQKNCKPVTEIQNDTVAPPFKEQSRIISIN
jgi:hypothetical protein